MDISHTLEPDSDQLDAVELLAGPRIFSIDRVDKGNAEQPVNIHFADFPRPWRPGKSMRRVLVACWGPDASKYVGRQVELFCDTDVVYGGKAVGGTRVSRLSHIDQPKKIPLLIARGKSAIFMVSPLPDSPALTPADHLASLRAEWKSADPERRKVIEAEVDALTSSADKPDAEPAAENAAPVDGQS